MTTVPRERLLNTRLRAAAAAILTGLVLLLLVHGPFYSRYYSGFKWPFEGLLHGATLVIVNVITYGWMYWIVFWLVRGTQGRERLVTAGWALASVMSPLRHLLPRFAMVFRSLEEVELAAAVLAAVSLLVHPAPGAAPDQSQPAT